MYFLAKLCRICVQSKGNLVALDSQDFDKVSFSEKLQACTRMVFKTQPEVSKEICSTCVYKLRISYEFFTMCKKSTNVLNTYVSKLVSTPLDINSNVESFPNTNIIVSLAKAPTSPRKKRIGKSERCAAIQKLLLHKNATDYQCSNDHCLLTVRNDKPRGGLKDLLSFTKSFDFGYAQEPVEASPLNKLIEFSESFFYGDFQDYKKGILCVIESKKQEEDVAYSEDSDLEDMFLPCNEESTFDEEVKVKEEPEPAFEEVMVERSIKQELEDCDVENSTNPLHYLQVCYQTDPEIKPEKDLHENNPCTTEGASNTLRNNYIFNANLQKKLDEENQQELSLLSKLTESGNPLEFSIAKRSKIMKNSYISPKLQRQYLYCKFKCDSCNRYFKSNGYLKAHNSKVHSYK